MTNREWVRGGCFFLGGAIITEREASGSDRTGGQEIGTRGHRKGNEHKTAAGCCFVSRPGYSDPMPL